MTFYSILRLTLVNHYTQRDLITNEKHRQADRELRSSTHNLRIKSDRFLKSKKMHFLLECNKCKHLFRDKYTQIHTPTVVQGGRGGGGGRWNPSSEFLIGCSFLKRFYLKWKAFDLLTKMRYILWVVALLEACDVTNKGRHLGFYQELEIRFKPREIVIFCALHEK